MFVKSIRDINMRIKLNNNVRPEFRKMINALRSYDAIAEFLSTEGNKVTANNVAVMKKRGYLSIRLAKDAETNSEGKYKAKMLAQRGEIV